MLFDDRCVTCHVPCCIFIMFVCLSVSRTVELWINIIWKCSHFFIDLYNEPIHVFPTGLSRHFAALTQSSTQSVDSLERYRGAVKLNADDFHIESLAISQFTRARLSDKANPRKPGKAHTTSTLERNESNLIFSIWFHQLSGEAQCWFRFQKDQRSSTVSVFW